MDTPRDRSVHFARAILDGSIDVVHGSRALAALRHDLGMSSDEDFLVFAAIDSEADRWPELSDRGRFNPEYLKQLDTERDVYLSEIDSEVRIACRSLLDKMSS